MGPTSFGRILLHQWKSMRHAAALVVFSMRLLWHITELDAVAQVWGPRHCSELGETYDWVRSGKQPVNISGVMNERYC